MSELNKQIGIQISNRRKSCNLTQGQLSEISGTHRKYIGMIESGRANPSISVLEGIADALGVELTVSIK